MFRLRVLGGFALEGAPGAAAPPRPQRRGDAVLAVLAVCGDLGCTRDRLVALLWPESDDAHSRHGLRDALHAIRRALEPSAVSSEGQLLRLDPGVVDSDVRSFTQALHSGRHSDAVRVYGGPLLEGFHVDDAPEFEHWLDGERTRLAREYAEALTHLATTAEHAGAWGEAVGWWARAVEHDPLNSHFVVRHMEAMAAIGDRANALLAADEHRRRLREELDLEPGSDVLAEVERIRRGEPSVVPARPPDRPRAIAASPETFAGGETAPSWSPDTRIARSRLGGRWGVGIAIGVMLGGVLVLGRWLRPRTAEARPPRTAVAVLPFENLSADSSLGFFASGLQDELQTELTKVVALKVIGRESVSGYRQTLPPLRQVAEELGVGSIVKVSVQASGNRLRVNAQLFDALTQRDIWGDTYERTLDDAFAVQSDIARQIVAQLGARLTSAEADAIATAPTQVPQAYLFYLQGQDYLRRPGTLGKNYEIAAQLYERALALDSSFALAHAGLSIASHALYDLGYDRTPARLERAQREADVALRLAPDLPQAHLANGQARYLERGDFHRAVDEFNRGLRAAPNDADLWFNMAVVYRNLGNWDSMMVAYDRARTVDPRNATLYQFIGDTYHWHHRYREAIEAYRRELSLTPDVVQPRLSLAWSYVLWKGELDTLRTVLQGLPLEADPGLGGGSVSSSRLALAELERRPDSVFSLLRTFHQDAGAGSYYMTVHAHLLRGDTAAARAILDTVLVRTTAEERAHPDDWDVHATRGTVLAELGRNAEALREARWLEQSDQYRVGPILDPAGIAWILLRAGEVDAGRAALERALIGPSLTTVPYIRLDPHWDPITRDQRIQAVLAKYADPGR